MTVRTANDTLTDPLWGEMAPKLGFFEPPPIEVLADHMAHGTWLDVRIEDVAEIVQRVRIVELRIRARGEDVVLRQDWLADEEFRHAEHVIGAELVWKIRKSIYKVEDVEPYIEDWVSEPEPLTAEDVSRVQETALHAVCNLYGMVPEEIMSNQNLGRQPQNLVNARHMLALTIYECTVDLPDKDICVTLGWRSVQPMLTAKWKVNGNGHDPKLRQQLQSLCKRVRSQTGLGNRARRPRGRSMLDG